MDRQPPVLDQINLVARDVDRSVEFYRRLGITFAAPPARAGDRSFHVNGKTAGLRFELDNAPFARFWNPGWAAHVDLVGRVVLNFGVTTREEVDRHYAALTAAGHPGLAVPHDAFWGARYAIVEDPNGVAIGLMSPIDPARKTCPAGWSD